MFLGTCFTYIPVKLSVKRVIWINCIVSAGSFCPASPFRNAGWLKARGKEVEAGNLPCTWWRRGRLFYVCVHISAHCMMFLWWERCRGDLWLKSSWKSTREFTLNSKPVSSTPKRGQLWGISFPSENGVLWGELALTWGPVLFLAYGIEPSANRESRTTEEGHRIGMNFGIWR